MLKLLKWDFLNFIKKYYWLYISFITVSVIAVVFPDDIRLFSTVVDGICAIYSEFFYGYTLIISAAVTINWLRKDTLQLELSLPAKPWKILLSKLILSICINTSGLLLTEWLWLSIKRFGMSNIVLFNSPISLLQYMAGMLILLNIFMFSYITSKSFIVTRNKARITTVFLSFAICTLITGFAFLLFTKSGVLTFTEINRYGELHVTPNKNLLWLINALEVIGPAVVITMGFFGSCTLLKYRFEQY